MECIPIFTNALSNWRRLNYHQVMKSDRLPHSFLRQLESRILNRIVLLEIDTAPGLVVFFFFFFSGWMATANGRHREDTPGTAAVTSDRTTRACWPEWRAVSGRRHQSNGTQRIGLVLELCSVLAAAAWSGVRKNIQTRDTDRRTDGRRNERCFDAITLTRFRGRRRE